MTTYATIMFGEVISFVPFIRPKHLKAMVRKELGVFITNKVWRNTKSLVLRKTEEQFKKAFMTLNNYVMELKSSNHGSSVFVVFEREKLDEPPMIKKMCICLAAIREGFISGCRKLVGTMNVF